MIHVSHVSKYFLGKGKHVAAVDDVSLTIQEGEIFGIVGYSGAGKSTFVRLLNQLEKADRGQILIDQQDITSLKGNSLRHFRRNIGMIFQSFNLLWSRTVQENIEFPMEVAGWKKEKRKQRSQQLLKMVGLSEKANDYPKALSGGQKQRVAIARALALNPKYLLSDEATSALDPKTTKDILHLLEEINQKYGITIIIITHQMEVVQSICHRLAVMAEGKIIEEGSVDAIFRNPQHEFTKKLIHSVDIHPDEEDPSTSLKERYPKETILRITFDNQTSFEPILYQMAKQNDYPFSILSANIVNTHAGALGVMYLLLDQRNNLDDFKKKIEDYHVKVEVL